MHPSTLSPTACDLFFLGAGRPAGGDKPAALKEIGIHKRALDWQLHSLSALPQPKIHFLGGYHIEDIIAAYPQLHYIVVPQWQENSVLHTLLEAPWRAVTTVISYADTIFRPEVLHQAYEQTADVVWVYDAQWRSRYESRAASDIHHAEVISIEGSLVEFTGLLKFSPAASVRIGELDEQQVGRNLIDLIHYLAAEGFSVQAVNAAGAWTEFNSPLDIAHFVLGTKAETLSRLAPLVKKSVIGQQLCFTVLQWQETPQDIICKIMEQFPATAIVIRSSAKTEDNWAHSHAGGHASVLNIDSTNNHAICAAITQVITSYAATNTHQDNQILVQAFLSDVKCSGVIFTRGLETGSPYYRINFDDHSCSTESVTSGHGTHLRTVLLSRDAINSVQNVVPALTTVMEAICELEMLLDYDRFDVEFAVDRQGQVHIFQVRPITVDHSEFDIDDNEVFSVIKNGINHFHRLQAATPFVLGSRTLFGVMPDWNPAEIIGIRPRPLAYSLYRFLITDDVWASQRASFGYRDVRPQPLLAAFCGQPYVDIRASLNSFIPATVDDKTAEKLIDAYLAILTANPHLHDKIEFDVAFTVWTPTFDHEAKMRLIPFGITHDQIETLSQGLKIVTRRALTRLDSDIASINQLEQRRAQIQNSKLDPLDKGILLLEDCRYFGTSAFAHAARAGFVAMSFLNSLVMANILSLHEKQRFLNSIKTVAGEFEEDARKVAAHELPIATFCDRYGHLRPGTYEITMKAYWEDTERYLLRKAKTVPATPKRNEFIFSAQAEYAIRKVLTELDTPLSFSDFIDYLISAIKARESVKFIFTRNLSLALDYFIDYGKSVSLSRDTLSYLQWDELKQLRAGNIILPMLEMVVKQRRKLAKLTKMIELPQLITTENNFYCFERMVAQPNFITAQCITAPAVKHDHHADLHGAIVLVPQADPGYDWLFAHGIAGLVTQYGGANSHMAIRAAEMALPAAIGVGDKLYEELSQANHLHLDCALQLVRGLV